jgi:hypothetical protein
MPKPPVWPALALTLLVADAGADPVRQHGAHQHGVAALNVAVEGESLYLELLTPAANLVGFEHAPRGPQQHAAVAAAEAALRDGAALLRPSQAARCRQREAEVPAGLGLAAPDEPAEEGAEHSHQGEHHDHHHPSSRAHEHHQAAHADLRASFHFACQRPGRLEGLDARAFFELFPATQRIRVQVLGAGGQSAAVLTPGTPRLAL